MLPPLSPLPYQVAVAALLERESPRAFEALSAAPTGGVELDQALLRSTYRLEPASHPQAHDQLARAVEALGLAVPVELYAGESGGPPNAELIHVAHKAVVILSGGLLELLDDDELCAVLGHELAHHVLWTRDDGRYLVTARLLEAGETDARTSGEYLETSRRFRLATELFADRGAAIAAGSVETSVSGLVKVATGLRQVDPTAYLRQADEVDRSGGSAGITHPENVVRAWALRQWCDDGDGAETAIAEALGPAMDLKALDVLGQDALRALTEDVVTEAITIAALRTPEALELAERFGVAPGPRVGNVPDIAESDLSTLPSDTRRYLCAVLGDLATSDPDSSHTSLSAAIAVAARKHLDDDLVVFLSAELQLTERERSALLADARALLVEA